MLFSYFMLKSLCIGFIHSFEDFSHTDYYAPFSYTETILPVSGGHGSFGKNHKNPTQPLSVICMNKKLTITISLLILLCFGVVGQALAQTRTPGVKANDYLVYKITTHWNPASASEDTPPTLIDLNNTKHYNVTINGISGANVTTNQLWDFVNGTELPYLVVWNLESAESYYMSSQFEGIVGANLGVGDLLHPSGNDSLTINQTITRNYASGARETNVVQLSSPVQNSTTDSVTNQTTYTTIGNQDLTFYLDKATGVLVEQRSEISSISPVEAGSTIWTLKETNLWEVSASTTTELSTPIIIAIVAVIVIVVVAIVFVVIRRNGHRKH
jgi:hypothetical protein